MPASQRRHPATTATEDKETVSVPATETNATTSDDPFAGVADGEIAVVRGRIDVTADTPEFVKRNLQPSMDGYQYATDKDGNILPEKVGRTVWMTLNFKTPEQSDTFVKLARRYLKGQDWKLQTGYPNKDDKRVLRYSVKAEPARAREAWAAQRAEQAKQAEAATGQGTDAPVSDGKEQAPEA
jgi:hypothetical protein